MAKQLQDNDKQRFFPRQFPTAIVVGILAHVFWYHYPYFRANFCAIIRNCDQYSFFNQFIAVEAERALTRAANVIFNRETHEDGSMVRAGDAFLNQASKIQEIIAGYI